LEAKERKKKKKDRKKKETNVLPYYNVSRLSKDQANLKTHLFFPKQRHLLLVLSH
jgi:hypothetical protein